MPTSPKVCSEDHASEVIGGKTEMKKPGVEVGLFVARIDAFESRFGGPISNQHHPLMRTERLYCSVCVFLLQCHGRLRRSITRSAKELRPRKKVVSQRRGFGVAG
jgi:hypothetical protein